MFRKYPETTPPKERKGSPVCVVSHLDAGGECGRAAIGEVWGLPFCEPHGWEAELSATGGKTPVAVLHPDRRSYRDALVVLRRSEFAELVGSRSDTPRR